MKGVAQSVNEWARLGIVIVVMGWSFAWPTVLHAQTSNNAVYNSGSKCCTPSPAFIDASVFAVQGGNLCSVLNGILSGTSITYPTMGAVIDARGLPFTTPSTSMTCTTANPSPW